MGECRMTEHDKAVKRCGYDPFKEINEMAQESFGEIFAKPLFKHIKPFDVSETPGRIPIERVKPDDLFVPLTPTETEQWADDAAIAFGAIVRKRISAILRDSNDDEHEERLP